MLLINTGCNNKELCFDHPNHVARYASKIDIEYDLIWEQAYEDHTNWRGDWGLLGLGYSYDSLNPSVPEGIRMLAFGAEGMSTENNLKPYGEEVFLPPGNNSIIFFNNDTEYIVFNDINSYESAYATTRTRSRNTYTGNPHYPPSSRNEEPEVTVSAPDVLFGRYINEYRQNIVTTPQELEITMQPLVFTYVVRYFFTHGYNYVALARGALTGMAGGVYLHNGRTLRDAVTILYDCELKPWGIEAVVRSFGIPDFPNPSYSRAGNNFALNLEVRLTNGKIKNFFFDVTEQMEIQPHGGVITVSDIQISDQEAGGQSSGFDVDVDGWGEFKDISINF